jgi:hypothetical protein
MEESAGDGPPASSNLKGMGALMRKATWMMSQLGPALLFVLFTSASAWGQDPRLKINNLDKLASKAAEVVDVTLDEPMLKLASKFMAGDEDSEDTEAFELVKDLKGVYVKSFEFDKEGEYSQADLDAIRSQLTTSSWSRMVGVISKHDGEISEIYMMTESGGKKVLGLAILAAEPKELTVVNIVGPIDIGKLSSLEGKIGIPKMGLEKDKKTKSSSGGQDAKK